MTLLQNIAIVAFVVSIFLWIWSFQGRLEQHENHLQKHDEELEIASRLFLKGGKLFKLTEERLAKFEKQFESKCANQIGIEENITVKETTEYKKDNNAQ